MESTCAASGRSGAKVTVVGYAQSNARVSTLMRNIEASPWLSTPELVEIKLVGMPGAKDTTQKINEFTLRFLIKRTASVDSRCGRRRRQARRPGRPPPPAKPATPAAGKKS